MKGKFNSMRDSALYFLCMENWSTSEFGDTEHYGGYVWKIRNSWDDVKPENTEFNSLITEWVHAQDEFSDTEDFYRTLVGNFLIIEGSTGAVTVIEYSQEELDRVYDELLGKFLEWQETHEDTDSFDDHEIGAIAEYMVPYFAPDTPGVDIRDYALQAFDAGVRVTKL